jgi:hypothetical protein
MLFPSCKPLLSEEIEKGKKWFSEITGQLSRTNFGIICLTRENLGERWILYEAGALSKSAEYSRVCPFLLDIEPTDLINPLALFQCTRNTKGDIYRLFKTIDTCSEYPRSETTLFALVDKFWEEIREKLDSISQESVVPEGEETPIRTEREILDEMLQILRSSVVLERKTDSPIFSASIRPEGSRILDELYPAPCRTEVLLDGRIKEDIKKIRSISADIDVLLRTNKIGFDKHYDEVDMVFVINLENHLPRELSKEILELDGVESVKKYTQVRSGEEVKE